METKKGALQISFGWMFAIIIGIFIIFFAIFLVSRFISQGATEQTAEASESIGILLNPLETGFEEGTTTTFSFPKETRIYNTCDPFGNFGSQKIGIQQENFNRFSGGEIQNRFQNRYIFSNNIVEGKNFLLFSKPLSLPFKVADLVYLTSADEEYCFVDAPQEIKEEITNINQANLKVKDCSDTATTICFSSSQECNITVKTGERSVQKNGEKIYYEEDALLYAAIFSNPESYECSVQRIAQRTLHLSSIYEDKITLLMQKAGCSYSYNTLALQSSLNNLKDSSDLYLVAQEADDLASENKFDLRCRLW